MEHIEQKTQTKDTNKLYYSVWLDIAVLSWIVGVHQRQNSD